jgi:hypothetical protein
MAMRLRDGVPEFDTVQEMIEYQRAMGSLGVSPAKAPAAAQPLAVPAGYRAPPRTQAGDVLFTPELAKEWGIDEGVAEAETRGRGRGGRGAPKRPAPKADTLSLDTVSKAVGRALGGMSGKNSYCPGLIPELSKEEERAFGDSSKYSDMRSMDLVTLIQNGDVLAQKALALRVSNEAVLKKMGLTDDSIRAVAKALRDANLLFVKEFPTKDGQTGESLVVATLVRDSSGQVRLTPASSPKQTQEVPALIAKAREIATGFGLRCPAKTNPYRRW